MTRWERAQFILAIVAVCLGVAAAVWLLWNAFLRGQVDQGLAVDILLGFVLSVAPFSLGLWWASRVWRRARDRALAADRDVIVRLAHLNFGLISVQDILHNTDLPPARVRRRLVELCRTGEARLKSGTGDDAVYAFGRPATPRAGRAN